MGKNLLEAPCDEIFALEAKIANLWEDYTKLPDKKFYTRLFGYFCYRLFLILLLVITIIPVYGYIYAGYPSIVMLFSIVPLALLVGFLYMPFSRYSIFCRLIYALLQRIEQKSLINYAMANGFPTDIQGKQPYYAYSIFYTEEDNKLHEDINRNITNVFSNLTQAKYLSFSKNLFGHLCYTYYSEYYYKTNLEKISKIQSKEFTSITKPIEDKIEEIRKNREEFHKIIYDFDEKLKNMCASQETSKVLELDNIPSFCKAMENDLKTVKMEAENCVLQLDSYTL